MVACPPRRGPSPRPPARGGGCAPRLALALVWRGRAPFDWNDRGRGDPERVRAAMDD
jgi:hypothetical protein